MVSSQTNSDVFWTKGFDDGHRYEFCPFDRLLSMELDDIQVQELLLLENVLQGLVTEYSYDQSPSRVRDMGRSCMFKEVRG